MLDSLTKKQRQYCMSRVKSKNTTPEVRLRSFLHKIGYRFRIHSKDLPGCPDIVLPKYKTIVFVHGCFWHQHPGCRKSVIPIINREFWSNKLMGNMDRDGRNRAALERLGWQVIVVWECNLRRDAEIEITNIDRLLQLNHN